MFTAMNVFRHGLCEIARANLTGADADETCSTLGRVTDMDLAIMTGTYVEGREEMQIATLQDVIVSHMPVTVLLLDANGQVTAATRSTTRLFGDVPAIGRPYEEALPPALVAAAELPTHMVRALTSGREVTIPRVDVPLEGQERNFRVSIVPLDHPRARTLLHVEELTEALATEGRLLRNESLAQLGALSAAVAHELRNPLAGISGEVRILIDNGAVRVSDSGPGVPFENAEKIFQPFFTTRTRGTGLGLAICRKAANAMYGRLDIGDGPLPGACFVLTLPVQAPNA